MGQKYLIDTNVISHLFANKIPHKGAEFVTGVSNTDFIISVAVEIEILTYNDRPEIMPLIEEFVNLAVVLPLDKEVTKKAIELRRTNRRLKLGDAIIGATAIVHQLTLLTNNVRDFINIKGLKVIDPHNV